MVLKVFDTKTELMPELDLGVETKCHKGYY
jgi:hypothetical protein